MPSSHVLCSYIAFQRAAQAERQRTSPSLPHSSPHLVASPPLLCSYIAFQRAAQAEQQRTDIAEVPADIPLNMMQELMTKQQVCVECEELWGSAGERAVTSRSTRCRS